MFTLSERTLPWLRKQLQRFEKTETINPTTVSVLDQIITAIEYNDYSSDIEVEEQTND